MSVLEMAVILVFIVPIVGLCIGFVLCVGLMQMQAEEAPAAARGAQETETEDQQMVSRYRAYAAQISNRRYVRPAGAMIRAAH